MDDSGTASAFPIAADLNNTPAFFKGLTKRELFAAMALQGLLNSKSDTLMFLEYPKRAVEYADALLKELRGEK